MTWTSQNLISSLKYLILDLRWVLPIIFACCDEIMWRDEIMGFYGKLTRDYQHKVNSWISFHMAPENSFGAISIFFQKFTKISTNKCSSPVSATGDKLFTSVHATGDKKFQWSSVPLIPAINLSPVTMTHVTNLPAVSFTPVAYNGSNYQTTDNLK
jgi:hypothetical protein